MERIFNFARYIALGFFSGLITAISDEGVTKGLMLFVFIASIFLTIISIIYPEDADTRALRVRLYLGR